MRMVLNGLHEWFPRLRRGVYKEDTSREELLGCSCKKNVCCQYFPDDSNFAMNMTMIRTPLAFLVLILAAMAAPAATVQPNIVLIVADDQGYADLGCADLALDVFTPNLDRLASQGVRFTQAYASAPICNASRVALITGAHQQRQGVFWYGGPGLRDSSRPTLAEILKAKGYATGYIGKFHYGAEPSHKPGHRNFPLEHGFDSFFGFSGGRKHYLHHQAHAEISFLEAKAQHQRQGQSLAQGPMWAGTNKQDQVGLSTELFGEQARRFIRRNENKPFYLHLAFNAVHNFTHQLPDHYLAARNLKGIRDWDPAKEEYYDWYRQSRFPNNPEGRALYLGQLDFLDREVGKVLDLIQRLGLREKTIVIYLADNGGSTPIYANNGPLRGSKYTLYEGGIRIPLIVSWPGQFQQGQVRDNVVSAMDLLPTFCRALGLQPPPIVDGIDIGPLLRGHNTDLAHETLYWNTRNETAIRHQKWKLRTATDNKHADYEMVDLELGTFLYDLEKDPGERENLAGQYPDRVAKMKEMQATWLREVTGGGKPETTDQAEDL